MHNLFVLAAPLALLLPVLAQENDQAQVRPSNGATNSVSAVFDLLSDGPILQLPIAQPPSAVDPLESFRDTQTLNQIRIQQRVVVRISPQPPAARQDLLAQFPQHERSNRYEERRMEKCVAVEGISGVQTGSGNRLVLFLRDQRLVSLNLEKACRARDFYSGFYIERNEDGKLCVDRDKLQSRTGARCEVERMRQLVPAEE